MNLLNGGSYRFENLHRYLCEHTVGGGREITHQHLEIPPFSPRFTRNRKQKEQQSTACSRKE